MGESFEKIYWEIIMNILVVGSSSMVGKRVIKRLKKNEVNNVYTAGRDENDADIFIDLQKMEPKIMSNNLNVDVIIHCAASFSGDDVDGCIKNGIINTIGTIRIAELAIKLKCKKIIYVSTIFSYKHVDNEYYGSYGISKKHGAEYLELICRNAGINFIELLVSQIYDEYGEAKKHQSFFYNIIDKASRGEEITIYGNLDATRNFLFIEDLVAIIERIINKKKIGKFYCCFPRSYKISEVAKVAYSVFGNSGKVNFDLTKDRLKKVYIPSDYDNLYNSINYTPQTDLFKGISLIRTVLY